VSRHPRQAPRFAPHLALRASRLSAEAGAAILAVTVVVLLALALIAPAAGRALPQGAVTLGAEATSQRFEVLAQDERVAEKTLKYAQTGWDRLAPHFTPPPDVFITIVVVQDRREYENIQPAPRTRGFATFGGETIYLRGDQMDQEVVTHELVHIMLGKIVRPGLEVPDWFNEGLAQYASGSQAYTLELMYRAGTGQILSLPALDQVDALQSPHREMATLQGLAVVRFLVDEFGPEKLWDLVDNLRYARSFNQALMQTYRYTDLEINERWMAYAEDNYNLLSPAMLRVLLSAAFGLLVIAAAVVWLFKRSRRLYGPGPSLTLEELAAAEIRELSEPLSEDEYD
jgi:hypothetical protein